MLQMPTATLRQCYAYVSSRRRLLLVVLLLLLLVIATAAAIRLDFTCSCEESDHANHGGGGGRLHWITADALAQCQKVSDFLIGAAYFSIPVELIYFASSSRDFPSSFKRFLFQFGAFIVPCGFTHLLAALVTHHAAHRPHALALAITASKLLTAVVSLATAISQLTLLPQLLRAQTREDLLRRKAKELDLVVGDLRRREQAGWDVGMLIRQIRASLDRRTVLNTTVVEMSKALGLRNCAVWMPVERGDEVYLNLVQESLVRRKDRGVDGVNLLCVPMGDPEVAEILCATAGAKILNAESRLAQLSGGALAEVAAAAVRVMLGDYSSGAIDPPSEEETTADHHCAVLVCVLPLPEDDNGIDWGQQELEVLELVADQLSVALSHAAALEEVQLERAHLAEQKGAIDRARARAVVASAAGSSFLTGFIRDMMRGPAQSIATLVDALAWEQESPSEHKLALDALSKAGAVLASLVDGFAAEHAEAVGGSGSGSDGTAGFFPLEMRPFRLRQMTKAAACIAKSLCFNRHFQFGVHVDADLPDVAVVGGEKRVVQVILHVMGGLLAEADEGFHVTFRVRSDWNAQGPPEQRWAPWKMTNFPDGHVNVEFKIGVKWAYASKASSVSSSQIDWTSEGDRVGLGSMDVTFNKCKRIVQMMQGNIWVIPDSQGCSKTAILMLPFQLNRQTPDRPLQQQQPNNVATCEGLRVLLADGYSISRATTRMILERMGCRVSTAASEPQCLAHLGGSRPPPFDMVILDADMADVDVFGMSVLIRKFRSAPWPLVLALVADGREGVWDRCVQAGMVGMIRKPVTRRGIEDEFVRVLRRT